MSDLSRTLTVGVVALLLGGLLVGAGIVLAGSNGPAPLSRSTAVTSPATNTITVAASGSAEAAPDQAVVRLAVEATADDPTEARRMVAENASTMRAALRSIGINDSAVRTTGFNIYEDRAPPVRDGQPPETTYRASHRYRIEVNDVDAAGEVIDTAVQNGATGVGGVEFTLSDATEDRLKQRALDAATAKARARATTLANRANMTVTDVAWMTTGDVGSPRPEPIALAAAAGDGGTAIESGPVTVRATVTVGYETAR